MVGTEIELYGGIYCDLLDCANGVKLGDQLCLSVSCAFCQSLEEFIKINDGICVRVSCMEYEV